MYIENVDPSTVHNLTQILQNSRKTKGQIRPIALRPFLSYGNRIPRDTARSLTKIVIKKFLLIIFDIFSMIRIYFKIVRPVPQF